MIACKRGLESVRVVPNASIIFRILFGSLLEANVTKLVDGLAIELAGEPRGKLVVIAPMPICCPSLEPRVAQLIPLAY